jgi:hypothetical protein
MAFLNIIIVFLSMGFLKCFITLATGGRMGSTEDELADTAEPAEMSESFIMDENREDYSVLRTPLRCQKSS